MQWLNQEIIYNQTVVPVNQNYAINFGQVRVQTFYSEQR